MNELICISSVQSYTESLELMALSLMDTVLTRLGPTLDQSARVSFIPVTTFLGLQVTIVLFIT